MLTGNLIKFAGQSVNIVNILLTGKLAKGWDFFLITFDDRKRKRVNFLISLNCKGKIWKAQKAEGYRWFMRCYVYCTSAARFNSPWSPSKLTHLYIVDCVSFKRWKFYIFLLSFSCYCRILSTVQFLDKRKIIRRDSEK